MKKGIDSQYFFKRDFKVRQEVNYEKQTSVSFIKDELQISIENNISRKARKKK